MNYRNMCWNQFDDFVNDIDYFQEKILCHSRPFFVYDQEQAEEDITKYIEEHNLYDDILSNGYDFLCDKTEVIEAFLTDVLWDFTLETGIGSKGYEQENFSLITNYSILKPDITKPYIVSGDTRYEVAKELLAGYDKDFSVNDAFKVLKSVSQKDLWATRVSFVYSTEKNKVYYVLNNDFSNVFEFQF